MGSQSGNTNQPTVAVGTTTSSNGNTGSSTPDSSDKKRLQGADLFRAIHNAFLVGWNLFELKSRIVVASYDIDKIDKSRPPIVPSFDLVDTLLKDVKNPRRRPDLQKLPVESSDIFWATTVWRARFKRIVDLQNPNSDTAGTVYNIPTRADKAVETFPYLYLYPTGDPNYTSIGVQRNPDPKFLENFRLYDATLRALNCLTLLFIQPGELLDFNVLKSYQSKMMESILKADPLFNPLDDKKTALKRFTGITIRLLEAWDGYLREYFYVGRDDEDNEIELIAYEAGRSMTSLSWGISALTVPIENELDEIDHSYKQIKVALKEKNKQDLIDRLDKVLAQSDARQQLLSQWNAAILEYDKDIASIKAQLSVAFVQRRNSELMQKLEGAFISPDPRPQLIKDVAETLSTNLNHAQLLAQLRDAFTKYDKRQKLVAQRDALFQQETGTDSLQVLKDEINKENKKAAEDVKTSFINQAKEKGFSNIVEGMEKAFEAGKQQRQQRLGEIEKSINDQQLPQDQVFNKIKNVFESNERQLFLDNCSEELDRNANYANYMARVESIFYNENQRRERINKLVEQADQNKKKELRSQIENVFRGKDADKLKKIKEDLKEIFVNQTRYAQSMEDVNTAFTDNNSRQILIAKIRLVLEPETDQAQLLKDIEAVITEADTLQQLVDELKADLPQKTEIIAQLTDTFTDYNKEQQIIKQLEAFLRQHPDETQPANGDPTKQQNPALSKKQDLVSDLAKIFDLSKKRYELKNQLREAIIQNTEYPQLIVQLDAAFTTYCDDQNYLDKLTEDATFLGKLTEAFGQDLVPSVEQVIKARNKGDDQKTLLVKPREKLKEIANYTQLMKELNEAFDRYDYYTEHLIKQLDRVFKQHEERAQCMRQLYKAWQGVFNERDIIHIQHKVASLSRSLDTSYKALNSQSAGTAPASGQNPSPGSNTQTSANGANQQNPSPGSNTPTAPGDANVQSPPANAANGTQNSQDGAGQSDADSPSLALDAIVHSLDYWQGAIDWIGSPNAQKTICANHSVVDEDDPIIPYQLSRQLRDALIQQADIWESLITCQRTLSDITKESVTQKVLSNFMEDCEKAVVQEAETGFEQWIRKYAPLLIAGGVVVLLISIIVLIVVILQNKLNTNTIIGGSVSGIVSILSLVGLGSVVKNWNLFPSPATTPTTSTTSTTTHTSSDTAKSGTKPAPGSTSTTSTSSSAGSAPAQGTASQKTGNNSQDSAPNNAPPDIWTHLTNLLQASGSTIVDIYQQCQKVVSDELQGLDQRVSVAAPLIEFFVLNSNKDGKNANETIQNTNRQVHKYDFSISDSYDFLTNVIWTHGDREEELNRLVRAASGPIGTFIGGKLKATGNSTDSTASKGSGSSSQSGSSSGQGSSGSTQGS